MRDFNHYMVFMRITCTQANLSENCVHQDLYFSPFLLLIDILERQNAYKHINLTKII